MPTNPTATLSDAVTAVKTVSDILDFLFFGAEMSGNEVGRIEISQVGFDMD